MRNLSSRLRIGAAVAGALVLIAAWSAISEYRARRQADELTQNLAREAEQNAQQAKARAQQYHAEVAANLSRRREDLYNTYQQVNDQARQFQTEQARRHEREHQEALRLQASYLLGADQKCVGGIVITRRNSTYSQETGRDGQPIQCSGKTASEPLR
jgi:gas vesicle protein